MQPIPGTEGYAPWAQTIAVVAFMIITGAIAAFSQIRGKKEAQRLTSATNTSAVQTAGAVMAMQPSADRMTNDALVATLASLTHAVNKLNDQLEDQERDREADEKAELRELRRIVKDIRARE